MRLRLSLCLWAMVVLALAGCAANPIKEAEGEQIRAEALAVRLKAEQAALDRARAREHQARLDAVEEGEAAQRAQVLTGMMRGIGMGVLIGGMALAIGGGFAGAILLVGKSLAGTVRAVVQAGTVRLDPETRQFPMMMVYTGRGKFSLANPNNGQVLLLDSRSEADRLMIQGSSAVQLAGAVAVEARKSDDPASVAIIRPVLVDSSNRSKG
jgi:hypothetical protein